jgi:hypothetical protein
MPCNKTKYVLYCLSSPTSVPIVVVHCSSSTYLCEKTYSRLVWGCSGWKHVWIHRRRDCSSSITAGSVELWREQAMLTKINVKNVLSLCEWGGDADIKDATNRYNCTEWWRRIGVGHVSCVQWWVMAALGEDGEASKKEWSRMNEIVSALQNLWTT